MEAGEGKECESIESVTEGLSMKLEDIPQVIIYECLHTFAFHFFSPLSSKCSLNFFSITS